MGNVQNQEMLNGSNRHFIGKTREYRLATEEIDYRSLFLQEIYTFLR